MVGDKNGCWWFFLIVGGWLVVGDKNDWGWSFLIVGGWLVIKMVVGGLS